MSGFTRSPKLAKGALIIYDDASNYKKGNFTYRVVFQYNPETMKRSISTEDFGKKIKKSPRLNGPPIENISLEIELDATDFLEHPDQNQGAVRVGVHPQLAALESILYPRKSKVLDNALLLSQGYMEIIPPEKPFILFYWGTKRVLPVKLTSYSVTEEAYDANLNPIMAKVSIQLQVLSYADFSENHPGYNLFMTYQSEKESMAKLSNNLDFGFKT
jgi:hypothetical protein